MGFIGSTIGGGLGRFFGDRSGIRGAGDLGATIGSVGGSLLPFKKGGRIPGVKGKPKVILAHSGEFILPVGVKPTKAQKSAVAKLHKKGKK